jgi:hypothetical protein
MSRMKRIGMLVVALLLGGCFSHFEEYRQIAPQPRPAGAQNLQAGPVLDVFPLLTGARFDYDAHFGLGTGMFSGEAIISVVDAWRLGNREEEAVRVVSRYFGAQRVDPYTFVREPGWIGLFEKYPPDKVTFFMPTTLVKDQSWPIVTGEGTGLATVEAIEPLTVPAGTFEGTYRVHYVNSSANTDLTLWLAPRVGLIKADVAMQVNVLPLRGSLELRSYALPVGGEP